MNIYQKLLEARKAMSFEKEYNSDLKYEILDGDTILEMVGDALAAQNILFIPSMIDAIITWNEVEKTYNNRTDKKLVQHAEAVLEMVFVDADTGESFTAQTRGSAQDYADKALGKAQTYAIKYFFTRMFLKGKSDVNDEERVGDNHSAQQPAQNAPQTAQKPRSASKPAKRTTTTAQTPSTPQNGNSEAFNSSQWASLRSKLIAKKLADNDMHAYGRLLKVFGIGDDIDKPWAIINAAGKTEDEIIAMFTERMQAKAS